MASAVGTANDRPARPDVRDLVTSLETAILVTVAYYDVFNRPLTAPAIAGKLCGWQADEAAVRAELTESRLLRRRLESTDGWFVLAGRLGLIQQFAAREKTRRQKWRRAEGFAAAAQYVPFMRGIIVGGSLAIGTVRPQSDIDLVCLTAERRLWTARLCAVTLRVAWNRRRRKPLLTPKQDKIDLLHMMTVDALEAQRQSLYSAGLLRDGLVLHDEASAAHRYAAANGWVREYWPGFEELCPAERPVLAHPILRRFRGAVEWVLSGRLGDGVEYVIYRWWSARWLRHWPPEEFETGRIVASRRVACVRGYFWEDDVMRRFRERLSEAGVGEQV